MHVQCGKDIVEQDDLRRRIHSTGEGDPGLLSSAQRKTLLANLGGITSLEQGKIAGQATLVDDCRG